MTNERGVMLDITRLLDYLKEKTPSLQELDKFSRRPAKYVDCIFYGYEEKDETGRVIKEPGLLTINYNHNLSGNPLSGDDTMSILDPITMVFSPALGYLIGIADERIGEADMYGAASVIGGVKYFSRPLSDFIYAFALTKMLTGE